MQPIADQHRRALLALVLLAAVPLGGSPSANANFVTRTSFVSTDFCNDPANPVTAAPAGLCQPNNPSQPGGNNPSFITATITMVDNGITLKAVGSGTGFTFGRTYVSLLYLNPTVQTCSRFPKGQPAQTVNAANADSDFNSMFVGFWEVEPDGTATLNEAPGKLSPLGNPNVGGTRGLPAYGTVSVREAAGGALAGQTNAIATNVSGGADVPPNIFALRACGVLQ